MGIPSLREDILERIIEGLSSLLRDDERENRNRSVAEEEARLEAIKRALGHIRHELNEYLEIATTPGLELAERVKNLELDKSALERAVAEAKNQIAQERKRTQEALQKVGQKDAEIDALKKEIDRLLFKLDVQNIKDTGGRGGPVRGRRS